MRRRALGLLAAAALAAAPAGGAEGGRARGLAREISRRVLAVERRLGPEAGPRAETLRIVEANALRFAEDRGPDGRLRRVLLADATAVPVTEEEAVRVLAGLGRGCPALEALGAAPAFAAGLSADDCGGLLRLLAVDEAAAERLPASRRGELRYGEVLVTQPGRRPAEGWDLSLEYLRRQAAERGGAAGAAWAAPKAKAREFAARADALLRREAEAAWREAEERTDAQEPWIAARAMDDALDKLLPLTAADCPPWTADAVRLSRAPWAALRALADAPTARDLRPLSPWAAESLLERLVARAAAGSDPARTKPAAAAGPKLFREVPAEVSGLTMPPREAPRDDRFTDQMPGGLAVLDYDGDGRPDLFLCDFEQARLFRNLGGFRFRDATAAAGLSGAVCRNGASSADYDNDGRPDLLLLHGREGRDSLWRDDGGRFREVTAEAGLPTEPAQSTSAVWLDYDGDGLLDLYVLEYGDLAFADREPDWGDAKNAWPHRLFKNLGGRFVEVSTAAGVADTGWGLPAAAFDADGDGRTDLLVSDDFGRPILYRNRGDGTFADATSSSGLAASGNGMGVSVADYDGDGIPDLFLTYIGDARPAVRRLFPAAHPRVRTEPMELRGQRDRLYRGRGDGTFEERPEDLESVPTGWGWDGAFLDAANSGSQDLLLVNGWWPWRHLYDADTTVFWRRDPATGKFRDASALSGLDFAANSRVSAVDDFDGDGCLDALITGFHPPRLFAGNCPKENHWLELRLVGERSNRDGLGAKATVSAGGRRWTAELGPQGGGFQNSQRRVLRFGLGRAARVDGVTVSWPSGVRQTAGPTDADRVLVVREAEAK